MRPMRVIAIALAVTVLVACRTTPPQPEESLAEQPERTEPAQEEKERPKLVDVDDLDLGSEDDEEKRPALEKVAPHVDARIQAAISRAHAGDRETALSALEGLIAEPEGGFLAAYNMGVLHDRFGEVDEAARRYVEALQRQPDFSPALVNLVRLYIREGQLSEAERIANRFVNARPNNMDHRAARLEVWIAQGRYEDAIEGARDVLRRDVRHSDAMLQMATANYRLGRLELAEAIIARALEISPHRAELYYLLALIALKDGDEELARRNLVEAIELEPNFPEARNHYAVLLHDSGNFDRAVEHLEAVVAEAPYFVEAWINLGNAYKAQGEYKLAEDTFLDALDIDENNADTHFNLGILYLEAPVPGIDDIPRYEKAVRSFNTYRQIVGSREASSGPVAAYINEATQAIEREQARQEQLRRAQMQEGSDDDGEDDDD